MKKNKETVKPLRNRRTLFVTFKNIRTLPSGYQVVVTRKKQEFSKHFAGLSTQSLRAALRWRDQILRELPNKRVNLIPRRVLTSLGLTEPVVGVFRNTSRPFYQVTFLDEKRIQRNCTFSWTSPQEEIEAYRFAVEFRRQLEAAD
ncbi:MAG: hypothetical protein ABI883_03315 [Chthoniobacterales bacterium]